MFSSQVISLMNSPHGQNLSRLANVGASSGSGASGGSTPGTPRDVVPGGYAAAAAAGQGAASVPDIPAAKPLGDVTYQQQPVVGASGLTPLNPGQNIGPIGQPVYAHGPLPPMSQLDDDDKELELRDYALEGGYFDDAILQNRLVGEDILKQLAKRAYHVAQRAHPSSPRGLSTPVDFKLENIQITETDEQAVIRYKVTNFSEEPEYDEDKHMEPRAYLYRDYGPEQFKELLNQRSDKYKRCILHTDGGRIYARVVDMNADLKEIQINGIGYCGQAFAKDEVVVEVETQTAEEVENRTAKGQVVGIVRRNVDPAENLFVCSVDRLNSSLMVPLNPDVPKMLNIVNTRQLEHVLQEKVSQFCTNFVHADSLYVNGYSLVKGEIHSFH